MNRNRRRQERDIKKERKEGKTEMKRNQKIYKDDK